MRRWLVLLLVACGLWAEDDSPRSLAHSVANLVEAQTQIHSACAAAQLTIPSGLNDVLVVRRTIAADWQRRLTAGEVRVDDAGVLRFAEEITALVSSLQGLANLARQFGDAPRRFPHCVDEPAFARYRTLVADAFTQGMQALIAGRLRDQVAPATWYARQGRHAALLEAIEAERLADEHFGVLPRDDRWLIEYREHLLLTRTTLERTLDVNDDAEERDRQETIRHAYVRLLDLRCNAIRRISDSGLPGDAPEVQVYQQTIDRWVAVLGRQVALARAGRTDDDDYWRTVAEAERQAEHTARFSGYAERWLDLAVRLRDDLEYLVDQIDDASTALAADLRTLHEATNTAYRQARTAFATACTAGEMMAALTATQAVDHVLHRLSRRITYLDDDVAIARREETWRQHANDPAIAEKLRAWDMRRGEHLMQRRSADEAADAALEAQQASERADLVSTLAGEKSARAEEVIEHGELFDLADALDEMVDLRVGMPPIQ